jgi:hypothetical protein
MVNADEGDLRPVAAFRAEEKQTFASPSAP